MDEPCTSEPSTLHPPHPHPPPTFVLRYAARRVSVALCTTTTSPAQTSQLTRCSAQKRFDEYIYMNFVLRLLLADRSATVNRGCSCDKRIHCSPDPHPPFLWIPVLIPVTMPRKQAKECVGTTVVGVPGCSCVPFALSFADTRFDVVFVGFPHAVSTSFPLRTSMRSSRRRSPPMRVAAPLAALVRAVCVQRGSWLLTSLTCAVVGWG